MQISKANYLLHLTLRKNQYETIYSFLYKNESSYLSFSRMSWGDWLSNFNVYVANNPIYHPLNSIHLPPFRVLFFYNNKQTNNTCLYFVIVVAIIVNKQKDKEYSILLMMIVKVFFHCIIEKPLNIHIHINIFMNLLL